MKAKNKTLSANPSYKKQDVHLKESRSAAVFPKAAQNLEHKLKLKRQFHIMPFDAALIKDILNASQAKKVLDLVKKLDINDKEKPALEIQYCTLNKEQFIGCGKEFIKKINGVRILILRGGWKRSAELRVEKENI